MLAYKDPNHEGNSQKYHTGKTCVTKGCGQPAGTFWSPAWCFEHNADRMDRIGASLTDIALRAELLAMVQKETESLRSWAYETHRTMKAMVLASGGKIIIQNADKDRPIVSEGTTFGDTTTTYWMQAKKPA